MKSRHFKLAIGKETGPLRGLEELALVADQSGNRIPDRRWYRIPATDDTLQIGVKRRQQVPPEALYMQRICSAALLTVFAIANGVKSCVKIVGRFDSRRLHSSNCVPEADSG